MKRVTYFSLILLVSVLICMPAVCQAQINIDLAKKYFAEVDSLCSIDNGNMWGVSLQGPIMFVDSQTKQIVASSPDKFEHLNSADGVYVGTLPDDFIVANTSLEWNGVNWTVVMWQAVSHSDFYSRNKLLLHESWHRVQKDIGIQPVTTNNFHLDKQQGAILIKLEFMVLKEALSTQGDEMRKNLVNALQIRKYRQLLFPSNNENDFELHEGMAEFTGFKQCGLDGEIIKKILSKQLDLSLQKDGLANSFAYISGPVYGILFDDLNRSWVEKVAKGESLPRIGEWLLNAEIPADTTILKAYIANFVDLYNAGSMIETEKARFENQKLLIDSYKQKFLFGDNLIITNNNLRFSFNPQEKLIPIDDIGVVYKTMRIVGDWGVLDVRNGVLRTNDWQKFIVPAPVSGKTGAIDEEDYSLNLATGWVIVGNKKGEYTLKKK